MSHACFTWSAPMWAPCRGELRVSDPLGPRPGAVPATSRAVPGPGRPSGGRPACRCQELADLADAVPVGAELTGGYLLLVGQLLVPGIAYLGPRSHRARLRTPRSRRGQSDH